jgi:hypothetical protein
MSAQSYLNSYPFLITLTGSASILKELANRAEFLATLFPPIYIKEV